MMDLFVTNMQFLLQKMYIYWLKLCWLWITVMFLSAVWTLILVAPIHSRGFIAEWASDAMLNVSKSILNQNDLLGGLCEGGALVDWERLFPCFYIKTFFFFCNLIIYTPLVCVNEVNNLVWALSQARSDEDMSLLLRQKISVLSFHAVSSVFCKSLTVKPWGEKRVTMHKTPQEKNYRHVYEVNNRVWVYIPVGVHMCKCEDFSVGLCDECIPIGYWLIFSHLITCFSDFM